MHDHVSTYLVPDSLRVPMQFLLLMIVISYLLIAFQFWFRLYSLQGEQNRRARTALGQLVAIFVFCSLCGYFPRIFTMPWWIVFPMHALLAGVSWTYTMSRQIDVLSLALDETRAPDERDVASPSPPDVSPIVYPRKESPENSTDKRKRW